MSSEPESNDLAGRLERAEAILRALARNEVDSVVSKEGPLLVLPRDVIEKERQASLLLEKLVRERTAELLKAKESAEVANRAKTTFLANMSHESNRAIGVWAWLFKHFRYFRYQGACQIT